MANEPVAANGLIAAKCAGCHQTEWNAIHAALPMIKPQWTSNKKRGVEGLEPAGESMAQQQAAFSEPRNRTSDKALSK